MWLCSSSTSIIEDRDLSAHLNILTIRDRRPSTLRVPIREGRAFTDGDRADTQRVAVVDETLAKQYWPGESALGKHLRNGSRSPWATIVGVVGHVKNSNLGGDEVKGRYYFPIAQVTPS